MLLNLVDQLRIYCRFGLRETRDGEWEADPQGCPAQLSMDAAAAHEATCGFTLVRCEFSGCGMELRRCAVDAHDAAEALRHARGEREARLALEARSAARFATLEASNSERDDAEARSSARFAAMEAALAILHS